MEDKYYLYGFVNIFKIVPDFVIPIFKKDNDFNKYYGQFINKNFNICFEELSLSIYHNCTVYLVHPLFNRNVKIRGLNSVKLKTRSSSTSHYDYRKRCYLDPLEAIYAFQNIDEIVYGNLDSIKEYIIHIKSEDTNLMEQINDFVKNIEPFTVEHKESTSLASVKNKMDLNNIISQRNATVIHELFSKFQGDTNYFPYVISNYDLIEILNNELKKYSCKSWEYKQIIILINNLLSGDNNSGIVFKNMYSKDNIRKIIDLYNHNDE